MADAKLTAEHLKKAIVDRYEPPEWHCESEVTLASRRLDVVALNLWGARSYRIVGFEIKVTRGDWLRELDQFQKSEAWTAVVDQFYVVTPPKLVRDDELPAGWGLLEFTGAKMMTRRHATVREGARDTLPREVAARFIDRLKKIATDAKLNAEWRARDAVYVEVEKKMRETFEREHAAAAESLRTIKRDYAELVTALGGNPLSYNAQRDALRAAGVYQRFEGDGELIRGQLKRARDLLRSHVDAVEGALSTLQPYHEEARASG